MVPAISGILIKVNPKHTSQTCFQCGHISKDNRKEQAVFKYVECGYEANADRNAVCNILRQYEVTSTDVNIVDLPYNLNS